MALKKTVRGKQKVSSQSILSKNNVSNNETKNTRRIKQIS